jgi:hypothetical protein
LVVHNQKLKPASEEMPPQPPNYDYRCVRLRTQIRKRHLAFLLLVLYYS